MRSSDCRANRHRSGAPYRPWSRAGNGHALRLRFPARSRVTRAILGFLAGRYRGLMPCKSLQETFLQLDGYNQSEKCIKPEIPDFNNLMMRDKAVQAVRAMVQP